MPSIVKPASLLFLLMTIFPTHAASFKLDDEKLFISGNIYRSDENDFLEYLKEHSNIKTIVFDKCLGGEASAAITFFDIIQKHALDTIVKNQAHSACALAFLAGRKRAFDSHFGVHGMLIHMPRMTSPNNESQETPWDQKILSMLDEATNKKIPIDIMVLIKKSRTEASGVLFMKINYGFFSKYKTVYCDGLQGPEISKCIEISSVNALKTHIISED